jgi:hypothetical protein
LERRPFWDKLTCDKVHNGRVYWRSATRCTAAEVLAGSGYWTISVHKVHNSRGALTEGAGAQRQRCTHESISVCDKVHNGGVHWALGGERPLDHDGCRIAQTPRSSGCCSCSPGGDRAVAPPQLLLRESRS